MDCRGDRVGQGQQLDGEQRPDRAEPGRACQLVKRSTRSPASANSARSSAGPPTEKYLVSSPTTARPACLTTAPVGAR
ncbi:hypothetical protein OHA72_07105 [Dactylosporangium sp. NBC_01737]|uniref:hypothetical protein n=1 Tax=Dactylosporangium sp. NBC_01737 TaxID=2975959 RepID=UPI002E1469D1|nr:hypothetical protein OHA72_07105 [Dactylosporangium sp. NBC_01737]